jgi:hypothetical protein
MVKLKTLLPIVSGLCVLLYAYGWYADIQYPAYVPLVWCFFCFVNDVYSYLETEHG